MGRDGRWPATSGQGLKRSGPHRGRRRESFALRREEHHLVVPVDADPHAALVDLSVEDEAVARIYSQAPEIDGHTIVKARGLDVGSFIDIKIKLFI